MTRDRAILILDEIKKSFEAKILDVSSVRGNAKSFMTLNYIADCADRIGALDMARQALEKGSEGCTLSSLLEFVKQNTPNINGETTMECVERSIKEYFESCPEDRTDVLFYDEDDATEFINAATGIDMDTIEQVINAEMKYMESIGIVYKEGE